MIGDIFDFRLGEYVRIMCTSVAWQVVGQTRNLYSENHYTLRRIEPTTGDIIQTYSPESVLVPVDVARIN
jgi:hypothetical protein